MKKKVFYSLFTLLLGFGLWLGWQYFKTTAIHINIATPKATISTNDLVFAYQQNESHADESFRNRVVEVHGIIKEITFLNESNTIILQSNHKNISVICDMQSNSFEALKSLFPGQKIRVKGICKGFLYDVILLNCILINTTGNE